jgi:hypothetical protein
MRTSRLMPWRRPSVVPRFHTRPPQGPATWRRPSTKEKGLRTARRPSPWSLVLRPGSLVHGPQSMLHSRESWVPGPSSGGTSDRGRHDQGLDQGPTTEDEGPRTKDEGLRTARRPSPWSLVVRPGSLIDNPRSMVQQSRVLVPGPSSGGTSDRGRHDQGLRTKDRRLRTWDPGRRTRD